MLDKLKRSEFSPHVTLDDVQEKDRVIKYNFKLKTREEHVENLK